MLKTIDKKCPYRIFQQLLVTALYVFAPLGPDQQVNVLQPGARSEQLLNQSFAHESRAACDEYRRSIIEVDHFPISRRRGVPVLAAEVVVVIGHHRDQVNVYDIYSME